MSINGNRNGWNNEAVNNTPKTYIDQPNGNNGYWPGNDTMLDSLYNSPRTQDLPQLASWAREKICYILQEEVLNKREVMIIHRPDQIRELWDNRPKGLDYVVLRKFQPIDFGGARYRFDNIYYNGRTFIRIIMDKKATMQLNLELYQDRYSGLVEEPENEQLKEIVDALMSQSEDQTARILNAISTLKEKPKVVAGKETQTKTPAPEPKKAEQPFQPADEPKVPYAFYNNEFFLGMMSQEYMVHNHPTLGFLVAL